MKTRNKVYAGVDLSLTSPAVCIFDDEVFSLAGCHFFYLTDKKKFETSIPFIEGRRFPEYTCEQERYDNISSWIIDLVKEHEVDQVFIEDYSFGSTGRVFNIAENCGLLKHKLWQRQTPFATIPPTVIKKFATGKGNSDKERLQNVFMNQTGVDIKTLLGMTAKQWNPSSDIIDSYFICACGIANHSI